VAIRIDARMSVCERKRLSDVSFMSVSKMLLVVLILSVFAVPVFVSGALGVDGEDLAVSAVDRAEVATASAYVAVLDAEEAGADVSGLLAELNVAGRYLVQAHVWLGLGGFDEATRFADLCYDVVVDVRNEAYGLKNEGHGFWVTDSVVRMTGSIVGVVFVVFVGFVVWRVFKRRYNRRVLGLRPEVAKVES
jgi:hypothetical protein